MSPKKYIDREQRKDWIYGLLAREHRPMTRLEIARAMGVKKTPHLIQLLDELVEEGSIKTSTTIVRGRLEAWAYETAE